MYDSILVPTDGSDGANRAVEHALDLAEHYGATVHALYVVDTRKYGEPALSSVDLVIEQLEDRGHELLDELADRADNRGISVEKRVCHGIPHEEIDAYGGTVNADLVVLGYQGQTHRNKMGSVVERVARMGGRPTLIV
ncbi:universal stress protein [Halomarina litorea]|uniref:universal stress protein n=1 Tax=Halomarina litorea TaxID=2961595 RepID=UPI0020C50556|nr:universal stress protein [Halomarina sp. BCD28]